MVPQAFSPGVPKHFPREFPRIRTRFPKVGPNFQKVRPQCFTKRNPFPKGWSQFFKSWPQFHKNRPPKTAPKIPLQLLFFRRIVFKNLWELFPDFLGNCFPEFVGNYYQISFGIGDPKLSSKASRPVELSTKYSLMRSEFFCLLTYM